MKKLFPLVVLTALVLSSCKDANEPAAHKVHNSINMKLWEIVEPSGDSPHAWFKIYNEYKQYLHTDIKEEHKKTTMAVFACDSNWNSYHSKLVTINDSTIPGDVFCFSRDFDNEYIDKFNVSIEHKGKEYNWLVNNLPNLEFDIEQGEVVKVDRRKPLVIKYDKNSVADSRLDFVSILIEKGHRGTYFIEKENVKANGEIVIPAEAFAGVDGKALVKLEISRAILDEKIPNTGIEMQHTQTVLFNINVK